MSTKIKYTHEPLGKIQVVPDFLPSPAELALAAMASGKRRVTLPFVEKDADRVPKLAARPGAQRRV